MIQHYGGLTGKQTLRMNNMAKLHKTFYPAVDCPACHVTMINCNSHNEIVANPEYMKCSNKDCLKLGKTYKRPVIYIEEI